MILHILMHKKGMKILVNNQIEDGNKMGLEGPKPICLSNLRLIRLECFLLLPRSPAMSSQYDDTVYSLFLLLWQRWNAEMYSVVDFFANPREPSSCGFLGGFYTTSVGQFGGIFGSMVYTKTLRSSWTQSAGMAAQSGPKWARPIGLSPSWLLSYPSSSRRGLSMTLSMCP